MSSCTIKRSRNGGILPRRYAGGDVLPGGGALEQRKHLDCELYLPARGRNRAGEYYLTATDANGVTAKSDPFFLSLYEAGTLTAQSTDAAAEAPHTDTQTLTVYNGYGVDKTVTSTGVGLLDGMGILLGMDTPTIGFATEQEINENFKLWTADDAMYKFNFKVDGDELNSSTVLPGMKIPANGYASWTVTLKNANALNAAQTKNC